MQTDVGPHRLPSPSLTAEDMARVHGKQSEGKMKGRAVLITAGSSDVARGLASLYASEGADITLAHLPDESDKAHAIATELTEETTDDCKLLLVPIDLNEKNADELLLQKHMAFHGRLDSLTLNYTRPIDPQDVLTLPSTFATNIHALLRLAHAALPHLLHSPRPSIILHANIGAPAEQLDDADHAQARGRAIVRLCRAMNHSVVGKTGILLKFVEPGPVWTPLINAAEPNPIVPFTYMVSPAHARTAGVLLSPRAAGNSFGTGSETLLH
ncbi:hypothetical protein PLICRDRAFT_43636 [Plicaturopsis crispa FD-325 SS-3]|nr:hypothetical protein PLICRDRAFT_43636 [Plicaturopsis crispa FD-325 SS-3]